MQNRYAGDVGDFLKLGLLRQLTAADEDHPALRLGIAWYLVPDEGHNADGKHVSYLDDGHAIGRSLRALDPSLHDALRSVIAGGRSIATLESSGALPTGTVTHAEPLDFAGLPPSATAARRRWRAAWLDRALDATASADLVFVDPDNGLRRPDHSVSAHTSMASKHCYLDELARFAARGQSVVAYHHADRSAAVELQIQRRMADLAAHLPVEPLAAVRASRGTTRLFLVAADEAHRTTLAERLRAIEQGPWGTELRVTWWDASSAPHEPEALSPPNFTITVQVSEAVSAPPR